jgi:serine/threonine protein kinase
MTPEERRRVEELCLAAIDCEVSEREAFLIEKCNGDVELLERVRRLLSHHDTASTFLNTSLGAVAASVITDGPLARSTTLGRYELVSLVGHGAMGEVYRAHDPILQRDVALKVLASALHAEPERLRRFEVEARAAAALNHPNIVSVFDVGLADRRPYVVTELLEGLSLAELITQGLNVDTLLEYAVQMADGLAAAHAKGIIHRDLKPENVFVTSQGRLKILDFGVAKFVATEVGNAQPSTQDGAPLGTVAYMAPEQARGEAVDDRSDLFSFGRLCTKWRQAAQRLAVPRQLSFLARFSTKSRSHWQTLTSASLKLSVASSCNSWQRTLTIDSVTPPRWRPHSASSR